MAALGRGESAPPEGRRIGSSRRASCGRNRTADDGPPAYNNNFELVQIPGYVLIFNEQIHPMPHHTDGWATAPSPAVIIRSGWEIREAIGKQYTGCRHHQFHRQDKLQRIGREHASDRTVYALRSGHACSTNSLSTIRSRLRAAGPQRFPWGGLRTRSLSTPVTRGTKAWFGTQSGARLLGEGRCGCLEKGAR